MLAKCHAITYCRNSANVEQDNSCDVVCVDHGKSGLNDKMRPEFQALLKHVIEDDSVSFVLVYDVTQWKRTQDRNRRRAQS